MSKLEQVRFDKPVAIAHTDHRRTIYEPERILEGLEGKWYAHNFVTIRENNLALGNHHHDYEEAFFTPTGGFKFALADMDERRPVIYYLEEGSRIYIPRFVAHRIVGPKGAVLCGYGNVEFNPKRLIPSDVDTVKALTEMLDSYASL